MKVTIRRKAKEQGYRQLTEGYGPGELWMLESAERSLDKGNIDHVRVNGPEGLELWRKGKLK